MSLTIRCPKHPRYRGDNLPRASCEPCGFIYSCIAKSREYGYQIVRPNLRVAEGAIKDSA